MTVKIDPAGRIVLPKPVRERLGLRAGMNLEMTESSEGLVLKPIDRLYTFNGKDFRALAPRDFQDKIGAP